MYNPCLLASHTHRKCEALGAWVLGQGGKCLSFAVLQPWLYLPSSALSASEQDSLDPEWPAPQVSGNDEPLINADTPWLKFSLKVAQLSPLLAGAFKGGPEQNFDTTCITKRHQKGAEKLGA